MIKVYTDGACSPNPGLGGWATIFYFNNIYYEHYGYKEATTNNVMEITAVIEGIKEACKFDNELEIFSDSQYVINTMTMNWKRNKNIELWSELDNLISNLKIKWTWVKGHSSNIYNSKCDELAVKARINKINK